MLPQSMQICFKVLDIHASTYNYDEAFEVQRFFVLLKYYSEQLDKYFKIEMFRRNLNG